MNNSQKQHVKQVKFFFRLLYSWTGVIISKYRKHLLKKNNGNTSFYFAYEEVFKVLSFIGYFIQNRFIHYELDFLHQRFLIHNWRCFLKMTNKCIIKHEMIFILEHRIQNCLFIQCIFSFSDIYNSTLEYRTCCSVSDLLSFYKIIK